MTFAVVGLDPAPFEVNGDDIVHHPAGEPASFLKELTDLSGFALELTADPALKAGCDFLDGIATRVGALDTIAFQPAGASQLVVGFAALPGALGRAITDVLGEHAGRGESATTAVIVGAGESAGCAIAAAVQHGFSSIVVAADVPGPAVGAAHRMDLDVDLVRLASLRDATVDLLINTLETQVEATPRAVCDLTGAWDGFAGSYVSPQLITAHQRQDQVRVLTGKSPQLDDLLAVL